MNARSQLERSVSRFFEAFVKGARCFLALEKGGRLCGFAVIDRYNDRTATLKWIFVSRDHQDKGIRSWLLDEALAYARSAGYEKATLCTATKMETAHQLYRSRGFVFKQWVTFWRQRMQVYENILEESIPELAE